MTWNRGSAWRLHSPPRFVLCRGLVVLALCLPAATQFGQTSHVASDSATSGEARAGKAFDRARADKANALGLEAFLTKMPKGADLHMHLLGAVYAETFLRDAGADNLCLYTAALSLVKNMGLAKARDSGGEAGRREHPICGDGQVPAANVFTDQKLYDELVDSFSMRGFVPSAGVSGHDQFFRTFGRFGAIDDSHGGEWLDEVANRAAAQNEQYIEVMQTPAYSASAKLGYSLGWPTTPAGAAVTSPGDATGTSPGDLSVLRASLLAGGLQDEVAADAKQFDDDLSARDRIEHCGEPNAAAACAVKIRYLYQVLRAFPPQQVFAQTLLAFEVASADPNVVGLNFVMPEDAYLSMSEYNRQMRMLDYLHSVYPKVHIALHAGELAPGMVPPEGLRFHIREAIDLGHAERIGHGVDVMYETDPRALLKEMADQHVMVEINLTSNDVILGIVPPYHPLPEYRAAHVPVALSTDDEGVSRIDLTHEYARAAMEFGLGYLDLKAMARTSLEHSFLPGESLWAKPDVFTHVKGACAGQTPSAVLPTADCMALLKSSQKAAEQWELEHRYMVFEANSP